MQVLPHPPSDDCSPTPADPVAAHAVEEARRQALSSLWGYSKISDTMLRTIFVSIGVSIVMNLSLWAYVLVRMP